MGAMAFFVENTSNDVLVLLLTVKLEKIERLKLFILFTLATTSTGKFFNIENTFSLTIVYELDAPTCPLMDNINFRVHQWIEFVFKNRHKNIFPYERLRVYLSVDPGENG